MKELISGFICTRCGEEFSLEKFNNWDKDRFINWIKEQGELCIPCCKDNILKSLKQHKISKFKLLKFRIKEFFSSKKIRK